MFKKYKRSAVSELREVTSEEINGGAQALEAQKISISAVDIDAGSPKTGDMIARNPINHDDQWLIAKEYFETNFEPFYGDGSCTYAKETQNEPTTTTN